MSNRSIVLTRFGGTEALEFAPAPIPTPAPGVAVVRVRAAGINGIDWKIREGFLKDTKPVAFPQLVGMELAGEIVAVAGESRFSIGDRVFGLAAPGSGAYADFVAVPEDRLASTPAGLSDIVAAALPVAGLTAWQMLHAAGVPRSGQTVLVHGASGGVGTLLVQMAKSLGLTVVATGSTASLPHLRALGVDRLIDRTAERFESVVGSVDLVIDLAGGDAPDRSWELLRDGGAVVSAVRPDIAAPRGDGRRGLWFMMQPDSDRLAAIGAAAASGALKVTISETVPLEDIPSAVERNRTGHGPGKAVADLTLA
ncbi:NADP-dependent oxidoreductase [Kaistia geumhonensis]|uniref:NADPH:quinone reductase-like Zn-dependent oxidoreductase n=1 Tax=Kaistia geumhonensis TaxID=410839 RepID=A0ABU0M106_9HYPH|nr:NADP-dependent oxidoreductase [Kaistia geumhonensis]MCX5480147.1 NADP-dependent oxidoreductase [Kaistia geumhonensis]MDQ0514624.1 NADPH:quinone reductase-like Zn-dependent oxidoreductase [Kaistia geumhonensis]